MNRTAALLGALIAVTLTSCGDSSNEDTTASKHASTAPALGAKGATATAGSGSGGTSATAGELRVQVGEMYVRPVDTAAKAGTYRVAVTNNGSMKHELLFLKTTRPDGMLPVTDGTVNADLSVGGVTGVAAHSTRTGTIRLTAGTYQLVCNLPGHYRGGMHAILTVT